MKKEINEFNKNTYLVFLLTIFKIWDIVKPLFKKQVAENISEYYSNYDWFGFIIQIITIFILYRVLKQYQKQRYYMNKQQFEITKQQEKIILASIIAHVRNKFFFFQKFEGIEYYRLPNESDDEVFKRLPQSEYKEYLKQEYSRVKQISINYFDKKPSEIQEILDELYGIKTKPIS